MRSEFMGENASLTTLFGEDVEQDIQEIAIEAGLPISVVRKAVSDYAPELLGEDPYLMPGGAPEPAKGSTFSTVFKGIAEAIGLAAPGIAAAVRGQPAGGTPATQAAPTFDAQKLIIPAGIGIILLLLLMKKK